VIMTVVAVKLPVYSQTAALVGTAIIIAWCVLLLIAWAIRSGRR
jgi:hypothetical protein